MERNRRAVLQGVVVSNKNDKTIVVLVETYKRHAKYQKRVKYANKYYAHDEKNEAKVGDTVSIMGCRPLSALKRFRLISIDKKAVESIKAAEAEIKLEEAEGVSEVKEEVKVEEVKVETPVTPEVKEEVKVEEPVKKAPAKKAPAKKTTSSTKKTTSTTKKTTAKKEAE